MAGAQGFPSPGPGTFAYGGGGGGAPSLVNSGCQFTGATAYTTSWSPVNGNTLIVWAVANSTTALTASDGEGTGNTYTVDGDITGSGFTERGRLFRAANISGSGAYTITIASGTTPLICVLEITGNRTLDTVSVGTNPTTAQGGSAGNMAPGSFTTTTANAILIDGFGSLTSNTATLSQTDGSFTTAASCLTGASCYVGAVGTRVVSATASYSDGWTATLNSDWVAVLAAYK